MVAGAPQAGRRWSPCISCLRGQNGWRIGGMIAIAVLAIAASIAAPYALPATAPAWASAAAAAGAGAAVSIGGTLALNALVPPPVPEVSPDYGNDKPAWAISGGRNRPNPWGKVPFLLGRFQLTPPYAAVPYREIVGGDVYWRALFALSHGPVAIEEIRIGETLLDAFSGVETEFRRGYWSARLTAAPGIRRRRPTRRTRPSPIPGPRAQAGSVGGVTYAAGETITYNGLAPATSAEAWDRDQGQPFRLYPSDVYEEGLAVDIETSAVRTTQTNADEIAVELTFPRGLCHIENDPPGKRSDRTVQIRIQQSPTGAGTWTTVATKTVTGRQLTPLFVGHRWTPADYGAADANGQYDVRVVNLSGSHDEERNFGNVSWIALRTITTQSPVPVGGIAMLAVRILSSGQLQGVLDELRVVAQTIARDYDAVSGAWDWRPTSSQPAALCRHVLQHPARQRPAADAAIDLARLAEWDAITRDKGRTYNGVVEAKGSLWQALVDIARVGRATPSLRDLIFSVVIDEPEDRAGAAVHPAQLVGLRGRDRPRADPARLPDRLPRRRPRLARRRGRRLRRRADAPRPRPGSSGSNGPASPAAPRRGRRAATTWRSSGCAGRSTGSWSTSSTWPASAAIWSPCSTT